MTILSIVNAAIPSLPDPSRKIRELWCCREEPNEHGSLYALNVTTIFDNNTAAGWVKAGMKLSNPTLFWVAYQGRQPDGIAGAQTPIIGGCSHHPLGDSITPPAEDMINDIGQEWDVDGEMGCPNLRCFRTRKTGFQKLERKLQRRIIR